MTRCKLCRKEIPDGTEYCKECLDKQKTNTNETYLDSLLNSVINTPNSETNSKKSDSTKSKDTQSSNKSQVNNSSEVLYEDVEDFDKFNINEDLDYDLSNELNNAFDGEAGSDLKDSLPDDIRKNLKDDIQIDDNELFGDNLSDLLYDEDLPDEDNQEKMPKSQNTDSNQDIDESKDKSELMNNESIPEVKTTGDEAGYGDQNQKNEPIQNNILPDEVENFTEDNGIDPSLDDLLHELEASDVNQGGSSDKDDDNPISDFSDPMGEKNLTQEGKPEQKNELQQEKEPEQKKEPIHAEDNGQKDEAEAVTDEDFFSLLNQIDTDDPVANDVKAIGDLLNESGQEKIDGSPNDVGGVFSDALKVVTNLHDPLEDELGIGQPTDKKGKKKEKKEKKDKKKDKKEKKSKKGKKKEKNTSADSKEAKTKKKGFFAKLFGKSKEDNTEDKANPDAAAAGGDIAASKDADKKKVSKKKADKKEKKVKKAKKEKASKKSKDTSKTKGASDNASPKEAAKTDKSNKENTDKGQDTKKENGSKEIKKQDKEPIQVIDEIEDEGKINRAGAFTVFLFFGLIVLLILAGTNIFSYTISIKNAKSYFDTRKYTEAYNEVYGIDIKAKDLETYDKIMTVMFVNKQLNSYNNYYTIKQYPEALDALLKGLKRYDKYVTLANMLGIKSDLDYVRKQILSELNRVFNLSEKDAMKIIKCKTQSQYSMGVYNAVIENMKNDRNLTVKE